MCNADIIIQENLRMCGLIWDLPRFCSTSLILHNVCHVPQSHFLALLLWIGNGALQSGMLQCSLLSGCRSTGPCPPVCSSRRKGICWKDLLFRLVHRIVWSTTRSYFVKRQSSFHRLPLTFLCLLHVLVLASHRVCVEARNSGSRHPFCISGKCNQWRFQLYCEAHWALSRLTF